MVTFRFIVTREDGTLRRISAPTDLVTAIQHVRYQTQVCGELAQVVANTKAWTREYDAMVAKFGLKLAGDVPGVHFLGNVPPTNREEGSSNAD